MTEKCKYLVNSVFIWLFAINKIFLIFFFLIYGTANLFPLGAKLKQILSHTHKHSHILVTEALQDLINALATCNGLITIKKNSFSEDFNFPPVFFSIFHKGKRKPKGIYIYCFPLKDSNLVSIFLEVVKATTVACLWNRITVAW